MKFETRRWKWKLKKQRRKATLKVTSCRIHKFSVTRAADVSEDVSPFALVSELSRVPHTLIEHREISLRGFLLHSTALPRLCLVHKIHCIAHCVFDELLYFG